MTDGRAARPVGPWQASLAAMCALLAGIGIARFSYTPLLPALIAAGWLAPGAAAYLGAANFVGYLVGALVARRAATHFGSPALLARAMMVTTGLSLLLCAAPWGFWWFLPWRFASGVAGAILMVVAPTAALLRVPEARRGLAGGVILTGVALGIAASGLIVPQLLRWGLGAAWVGLGVAALLLTGLAWRGLGAAEERPASQQRGAAPLLSGGVRALAVAYAFNAMGLVPHMVFLADYVARGLGEGVAAGAAHWVIFGIGALCGPVAFGFGADRIGFTASLRIAYVVQVVFIGLLAVTAQPWALAASSFVIGAYIPGITSLVLGRVRELTPGDQPRQQRAWTIATIAFALGQAAGAYGFSALYAQAQNYAMLYALGAAAVVVALVIDLATRARR